VPAKFLFGALQDNKRGRAGWPENLRKGLVQSGAGAPRDAPHDGDDRQITFTPSGATSTAGISPDVSVEDERAERFKISTRRHSATRKEQPSTGRQNPLCVKQLQNPRQAQLKPL